MKGGGAWGGVGWVGALGGREKRGGVVGRVRSVAGARRVGGLYLVGRWREWLWVGWVGRVGLGGSGPRGGMCRCLRGGR